MSALQVLLYLSFVVFIIAVIVKVRRYQTAPVHMRWELYPVAHEKGRHQYGGSFFEESEWWKKEREIDHVNEAREMAAEILLLKGVRLNNRKLWIYSFPFHGGLYLLCGWMGLILVGAILQLVGIDQTGVIIAILRPVTSVIGYAGLALTGLGALGLFFFRVGVADMRKFNAPADYLHLIWFVAAAGLGLWAYATQDPAFDRLRGFVAGAISFRAGEPMGPVLTAAIAVGLLLIAYIPFTRMVHFAAKYFLYHDVRWSDEPNARGSKIEQRVMSAFNYGVSWRADHIQTGKTWAEVATEDKE